MEYAVHAFAADAGGISSGKRYCSLDTQGRGKGRENIVGEDGGTVGMMETG